MSNGIDRRAFLKTAGMTGIVLVTGVPGLFEVRGSEAEGADFTFLQLSDTHWGFKDPKVNPDFAGTLAKAVAAANALGARPDFIVFTGDLTHTTDDPAERRKRLAGFKEIAASLKAEKVRFLPGEHDASLDRGEAFREFFGETRYSFDHKGVHFVALDNVSDPAARIGDEQLKWLADDLSKLDRANPLVVLTHRPLFDLYPQWDWATRDSSKAIDLLAPFRSVTVLYGHIHQEHHHAAGNVSQHAAMGLMYPLPAPGSLPKKAPVPWDPAVPYKGLGFRGAAAKSGADPKLTEYPLPAGGGPLP